MHYVLCKIKTAFIYADLCDNIYMIINIPSYSFDLILHLYLLRKGGKFMSNKLSKVLIPLLVFILILGAALSLCRDEVYAEDPQYPDPSMIQFGYSGDSIAFSENLQYYKNGDEKRGRFTGTSTDYNAYYNKNVGILALQNYNGPTINVLDGDGESLAILVAGNCRVNGSKYGIVAPNIKLEIRGNGSLTVNVNNTDPNMWPVAGIASYSWNDESVPNDEGDINGTITISGNIAVRVNVSSAGNGNGVVSYGNVVLKDYAALTVDTRICGSIVSSSDVPNNKLYRASSLFIGKGSLVVETNKIVDFRLYDTTESSDLAFTYVQADNDNGHMYPVVLTAKKCPQVAFSAEKQNSTKPGVCNRDKAYLTNQNNTSGYTYYETQNYPYCYKVITLTKTDAVFGSVPLTGANFPDPYFRDYIEEEVDVNNDRSIDSEEADILSELDIGCVDGGEKVKTLKGIEHINVEGLYWQDGSLHYRENLTDCKTLQYIDVSRNPDLTILYAQEMPYLEQLYCSNCSLQTCWTKDCPSLIYLDCSDNQLEQIDVNASVGLKEIYCSNNKLKVLGLSKCTLVERVDVSGNPVELMDYHIATCKKLKALYCNNCVNMTRINVTNHPDLEILDCRNCGALEGIDVSKNTKLSRLLLSECTNIGTLDVSNCTSLQICRCWGAGLTELVLGALPNLEALSCYGNQLDTLDIRFCPAIVYAYQEGRATDNGYYFSYIKSPRFGFDVDKDTVVLSDTICYVMSFNATLSGELFMNTYNVPNYTMLGDDQAYFRFSYIDASKRNAPVPKVEDILIKDTPTNVSNNITRRVLSNKFFIAQLHDYISIEVFNGSDVKQPIARKTGSIVVDVPGGTVSSTAWDYLEGRIANSTNKKMVALAKAVEYYGTAAQLYFDYNTAAIPASALSALNSAIGNASLVNDLSAYEATVTGTLPAGIDHYTSSLVVEADHSLVYHFYLDGSKSISNYSFYIDFKDGNGYTKVTPVKEDNNKYCIQVSGIPSGYLSRTYKFKVTGGSQTCEISASALSYAYGRVLNSTNPNMVKMAKALYLYSMAANDYFGTGN